MKTRDGNGAGLGRVPLTRPRPRFEKQVPGPGPGTRRARGSNYPAPVNTRSTPGQTRYPFCTRLPDPVTTQFTIFLLRYI